jgi:uncharacterized protein (TIGR03435 family)
MIGSRCWIFAACFWWILAPLAFGQEKPARLVYEVASVRPSGPDAPDGEIDPLPNGVGYSVKAIPVKIMLSIMYRVPLRQIVGGPIWLNNERFDVEVRADHSYSIDDLHIMFQNLLADRFQLKLHKEIKSGPVYLLTIAKSGLKMNPVDAGKNRNVPITDAPNYEFIGSKVPMNYLCYWLGLKLQYDQRPVVDKTGLTGTYDFKLSFRPQLPPDASREDQSPELENLSLIFDAVKDQLGLQLARQKGPVETLVIDHAERPTEN